MTSSILTNNPWKVVAIIAIAVVDLAFIALFKVGYRTDDPISSIDAPLVSSISTRQQELSLPPQVTTETESAAVDTVPQRDEPRVFAPERKPMAASPRSISRGGTRSVAIPRNTGQTVMFSDTVIWIKNSKPIQLSADTALEPAAAEQPAKPAEQPHKIEKIKPIKRSFMSRTVDVLTKPYDWVRTLGEKMSK